MAYEKLPTDLDAKKLDPGSIYLTGRKRAELGSYALKMVTIGTNSAGRFMGTALRLLNSIKSTEYQRIDALTQQVLRIYCINKGDAKRRTNFKIRFSAATDTRMRAIEQTVLPRALDINTRTKLHTSLLATELREPRRLIKHWKLPDEQSALRLVGSFFTESHKYPELFNSSPTKAILNNYKRVTSIPLPELQQRTISRPENLNSGLSLKLRERMNDFLANTIRKSLLDVTE